MPVPKTLRPNRRPRRDVGRFIARVLCGVFALIGVIPLALGLLVRTSPVRSWAANETSAILQKQFGVSARYEVHVQAWPMLIALDDVRVDASDGGPPFLEVERVAVRPRAFSLLGGRLDVGDVEVTGPRIHAVVEDGKLKNVAYRLPKTKKSEHESEGAAPISSISITDARIDATIEGVHVVTRQVDLDVTAEEEGAFELSLRAGTTGITRTHPIPGYEGEDAVDDDVVCRLDLRARIDKDRSVLVRRMLVQGSADFDPDAGTAPGCQLVESDWRAFEVRLGAVRVRPQKDGKFTASGRVHAKVPVPLVHRFIDLPHASGSVTLDLEADYDGISKLPRATGHISGDRPGIDGKVFATAFNLDVATTPDGKILVSNLDARWGDGKVSIADVKIEPFAKGIPLATGPVLIEGIEFHALMRDLGVHPQAHVGWTLDKGRFEHFKGTLDPVSLDGPLAIQTHGFEIWSKPVVDPTRTPMLGVHDAMVRGVFQVRPQAVVLSNMSVDTASSHLRTTVSLGFRSVLDIDVQEGSQIDLAELSPLIDIPWAGVVSLHAQGHGPFDHPKIEGELAIQNFVFGGMPVGDLEQAKVAFEPLTLELTEARIRHNASRIRSDRTRIAFDKGADVLVDTDIDTREAPNLRIRDFLEVFHLDKDPRFTDIDGTLSGKAQVHYALGGQEDRCGGGLLDMHGALGLADVELLGEKYDDGNVDLDFKWDDQLAGDTGMQIDVHSAQLRKGTGSVLARLSVRHGGVVQGSAVATGLPISSINALGNFGKQLDGSVSMVAEVGGTLSDIRATADVSLTRVRIGPSSLPPSRFRVAMEPSGAPRKVVGRSRCGNERGAPFDKDEYARDASSGNFRFNGTLFDGQVALRDVAITRQQHKILTGKVGIQSLDLGTLANLIPGVAFSSGSPPHGLLTAELDVRSFPFDAPGRSDVTLFLQALIVERDKNTARLLDPSGAIRLADNQLTVPDLRIEGRAASGLSAVFVAGGKVKNATTRPELDLGLAVEPIDLSRLSSDITGVERAAGVFDANLHVAGPTTELRYEGAAHLRKGELNLKGFPLALDDMNVDLEVMGGDLRIRRATAHIGGGTIEATGRLPLRGRNAGAATATITARAVKLPVADGVNLTADADLEAVYLMSGAGEGQKNLPDIKGSVSLTSFSYTRPIALSVDITQLGRTNRTTVDTYDPANDKVRFTVNLISPRPLRFSNNLVNMELEVVDPGVVLSGTNQRFGARGLLKIAPESKIMLRSNEFVVREGYVRFDDATRIAPKVDLRATTEYRRYVASASQDSPAAAAEGSAASAATSPGSMTSAATIASNGIWRINLHAHGDADNLKVDLTSEPTLQQDDIVLLLTIGMTRAELDRSSSSLGESVGLEALSSLTGADKAVKSVVPVIDDFHFGSAYDPRTGQTGPTVTVGKRLTNDVHASVTTGLTEDNEVQSTIAWQLNKSLSVEATYDNINEVSSSLLGNIGADLRWRLEFE